MLQIGPKYKIARRLGSIFEKTQSQKFAVRSEQRAGRNKGKRPKQPSEYGKQLLEKQKMRYTYGLKEKHLASYVQQALSGSDDTISGLYALLERRLDSVVYRAGFAATRRQARQMVSHGHFLYNGRKVTVPSIQVNPEDVITVREGSQSSALFVNLAGQLKDHKAPGWMNVDGGSLTITINDKPETAVYDFDYKKIIEYYTR